MCNDAISPNDYTTQAMNLALKRNTGVNVAALPFCTEVTSDLRLLGTTTILTCMTFGQ